MSGSHVQVLDRSLDIIEQLATSAHGLSIAELSASTGLPKSTVHRILSSYVDRHYIERNSETSIYSIGYKFVELASMYLNKLQLKTEAAPIMHEITVLFNAISYLGVLDHGEVMYLERAEQFNNLRLYAQIGKREPVNCTALGKVLLSSLPEQDCERFVRQMEFRRLTANSITSPERLLREVADARRNGFATDRGEHTEGSSCVAVPIYDYTGTIVAAMSVSGYALLETYDLAYITAKMQEYGGKVSTKMGYTCIAPKTPAI